MGRHAKRNYLINLYDQFYIEQQKNFSFRSKSGCRYCLQTLNLEEELLGDKFSTENRTHDDWLMIYFRNNKYQITLFPVLKNGFRKKKQSNILPKMNFVKERYQASEDVTGYDLFATETLTLFPEKNV